VLGTLGAVGGLSIVGVAESSPRLEVGVTPTAAALKRGAEPIMLTCRSLERSIAACVPERIERTIGPHGIREPPERTRKSARSALSWWRSNRPNEYADAEVLVFSSAVEWDHGGLAETVGGTVGVAAYGEWMYTERHRRVVLHEVGHCLGMDHRDGRAWTEEGEEVATPMAATHPDRATLRYSEAAEASLRRYCGVE